MVLLTLFLLLLNPAYRLWFIYQGIATHSWSRSYQIIHYQGLFYTMHIGGVAWVLIFAVLFCASTVWGAYAGIKLWTFQKGAVRTAKRYFLYAGLLLHSISFLNGYNFYLFLIHNHLPLIRNQTLVLYFIFMAIHLAGFLYLSRSRRVAAAYPLG